VQLQASSFEHSMTIGEIVTMHRACYGAQDRRLVEMLEIEVLKDKVYGRCSGGERQRANLFFAMASLPDLLILGSRLNYIQ
jgi:ABC-type multidrug transport system ATPase subunit